MSELRPYDRGEHRLKFRLRLSEFGQRIALGHDAAASKEPRTTTVGGEFGTPNRDSPSSIAASIAPTDGTAVTSAVKPLVFGNETQAKFQAMLAAIVRP